MAELWIMTDEQQEAWQALLTEMSPACREIAQHYPPNRLYRLKDTRQRCTLVSYSEPGDDGKVTFTVAVTGRYNLVTFARRVFGIPPETLEECDLPPPDEPTGQLFDEKETEEFIAWVRARGGPSAPAAAFEHYIAEHPDIRKKVLARFGGMAES